MLLPNKHSHPDETVLAASTYILRELRRKRVATYSELHATVAKSTKSTDFLFLPAINFLYIIGLLEYNAKTDSFEYTGK